MTVEAKIRKYMLGNFMYTDDQSMLNNDESFLDKGIIDSTGILEVILFLEEEFDISIADKEMIRENLDSVNSIIKLLSVKAATGAPVTN